MVGEVLSIAAANAGSPPTQVPRTHSVLPIRMEHRRPEKLGLGPKLQLGSIYQANGRGAESFRHHSKLNSALVCALAKGTEQAHTCDASCLLLKKLN